MSNTDVVDVYAQEAIERAKAVFRDKGLDLGLVSSMVFVTLSRTPIETLLESQTPTNTEILSLAILFRAAESYQHARTLNNAWVLAYFHLSHSVLAATGYRRPLAFYNPSSVVRHFLERSQRANIRRSSSRDELKEVLFID